MHSMGLHSALAIKRQRKRREEQKRARERRFSSQSTESGFTSPRNSIGSLDVQTRGRRRRYGSGGDQQTGDDVGSKVVTSIGMLHVGVVFLVLGAFLLISGLIPGDLTQWSSESLGGWFNELVLTGGFAFIVGIFLIGLNKIISKREEDDLNEYVQRQLTRSRSGHRLVRDVETGCLTTKHDQRAKMEQREEELRRQEQMCFEDEEVVPVHSPQKSPIYSPHRIMNGDVQSVISPHLDKIMEEEISEKGEEESRKMDYFNKEIISNGSSTTNMSPGTPSETHELLSGTGRYLKMSKI
ncbi:uncharacterized protein LOC110832786 isoform X1 [Zootermopsis nevadensis]|uniref:uncharacterized protein LOC110832786 isoform X1 n=1 Tax=Zootermopsis nevadensis TaxID=136037 RepID=UPI000B8E393D|nr:uncharacterized protein LOC110832786 isoform X1 [Zootermopsis nevadensis]XP_021925789.1 uncharacterized protein LOC110832786 isoform X1 [Zootermopsis nevadensis]XP_021925793.1 uncharacterized protein LOC110832786 isoform X1 [Zootermopsis nevadensis]